MITERIKIKWIHLILFLIFCAAMNLFNKYFYFTFAAFGILFLKKNRRFAVELFPLSMLLLLALSWLFFSPYARDSVLSMLKTLTYFICYLMGSSLIDDDSDYYKNKIPYNVFFVTVTVIAAGLLTHYFLNWMFNNNLGVDSRNTIDIWTGVARAATGQTALACIALGLAIALIFSPSEKKAKTISWIALIVIMGYNLVLAGRTLVVMLLIVAAIAFIHQLTRQKNGRTNVIFGVILFFAAIIVIYVFDIFNIRTIVEGSSLYNRFFSSDATMGVDEDNRMENKVFFLKNMIEYPWGGANMYEIKGFAHDIFLDTYDEAGLFSLVAMAAFLMNSFTHLIKCIKNQTLDFSFRQIVLCAYVAMYIEFMVEPILQGMPWFFASFCLIDGYVSRILKYSKNIIKSDNDVVSI